ncbi:MAG: transposase [candidate division Zixibacteria bacterium]|nr:transposase [candidate division Zixibacteria bacterium]
MKDKLPKRKPTRLKDYDYASTNAVFFLTVRSQSNRQVFKNPDFNFKCIDYIKEEKVRLGHAVYVFCLMPDHLHFLISPLESNIPVTQYMNGLISKMTRLSWNYGYSGKLMQRSFHDHVVREEEDLRQIAEYILYNPVRKGLAQKWEDYPYCGLIDPLPI